MNPPTIPVTRRIKRISPLQLGKMLALLYGIIGLIAIPFFLFIASMSAHLPPDQRGPFIAMGTTAAFFAPILYGVIGFIIGVIGAVIYNFCARWAGGIEVELE
jgi:hypothetical protein